MEGWSASPIRPVEAGLGNQGGSPSSAVPNGEERREAHSSSLLDGPPLVSDILDLSPMWANLAEEPGRRGAVRGVRESGDRGTGGLPRLTCTLGLAIPNLAGVAAKTLCANSLDTCLSGQVMFSHGEP